MATYLSDNPHIVVNGFVRSGIPGALDGLEQDVDSGNESSQDDYSYDSYSSEEGNLMIGDVIELN